MSISNKVLSFLSLINKDKLFVLLIFIFAFIVRIYQLDGLPAAMWGDVITHHRMADDILAGDWYFNFRFGGDGPLFSYWLALIFRILGTSFFSIKLATVIIGSLIPVGIYLLAKSLFPREITPKLAALLAVTNFWGLSFSRQGKPYILASLLTTLTLIFAIRNRRKLAAIFLGLGFYSQIAFWGTPLIFLTQPLLLAGGLLVASPILITFVHNFDGMFAAGSHFGEKSGLHSGVGLVEIIKGYLTNFYKNQIGFFTNGNNSFRDSIPQYPHLDPISATFLVVGIVIILYLIVKKKKRSRLFIQYLLIPFVVLQIPSILDIQNPLSTPSLGRLISLMPIVLIIAAKGISHLSSIFTQSKIRMVFLTIILVVISLENLRNYFVIYPQTLPNNNIPFGKIIARYIDQQPNNTQIVLVDCCWGEWGQPEPDAIKFNLQKKRAITAIKTESLQYYLQTNPPTTSNFTILILDPRLNPAIDSNIYSVRLLTSNNQSVAKIIRTK